MQMRPKTLADFLDACAECELWVVVDEVSFSRLRAALEYQKGAKRARGRGLRIDVLVGDVQLLKGDRLEATKDMLDVANFEKITLPHIPCAILAAQP